MKIGHRAQVVAALFVGAAFGAMTTGCFAIWLGVARADGSAVETVVQCGAGGQAVLDLGTTDPRVQAGVTAIVPAGGGNLTQAQIIFHGTSAMAWASMNEPCPAGMSAVFFVAPR